MKQDHPSYGTFAVRTLEERQTLALERIADSLQIIADEATRNDQLGSTRRPLSVDVLK